MRDDRSNYPGWGIPSVGRFEDLELAAASTRNMAGATTVTYNGRTFEIFDHDGRPLMAGELKAGTTIVFDGKTCRADTRNRHERRKARAEARRHD